MARILKTENGDLVSVNSRKKTILFKNKTKGVYDRINITFSSIAILGSRYEILK